MTHMQRPVLLHVWMTHPEAADAHIQRLAQLFAAVAGEPGFVSARILQDSGRSSIAAIIEMRTVEDRRRLEELPVVHETLHGLEGSANLVARLYDDVAAFSARG